MIHRRRPRNFFFGTWAWPLAVFGFVSDSWDAYQVRRVRTFGGVFAESAEFSHVLPRWFRHNKVHRVHRVRGVLPSSVSSQSRAFWPFVVWIGPFVHRVPESRRVRRFNEDRLVAEFSEDPQKRARSAATCVREFP